MSTTVSKIGLLGLLVTLTLFWETISVLGNHGEFSQFHFEANSERFLLVAPIFLLIWIARHLMPKPSGKNVQKTNRN